MSLDNPPPPKAPKHSAAAVAQAWRRALERDTEAASRNSQLAVLDPVRVGQFYRLPSGNCVMVTGVNGPNIACRYEPSAGGTHDEVGMRREFFLREAKRINPLATKPGVRS